jgi:hypothetical protein
MKEEIHLVDSHNIDLSTYQVAQALQKITTNNQFFRKGRGGKHGGCGNRKY